MEYEIKNVYKEPLRLPEFNNIVVAPNETVTVTAEGKTAEQLKSSPWFEVKQKKGKKKEEVDKE